MWGEGVAHPALVHAFQAGSHVAHFSRFEFVHWLHFGSEHAQFHHVELRAAGHEFESISALDGPVHHPHVGHHALVGVVMGIEDKGAQRRVRVAGRWRHPLHHGLQHLLHVDAFFGRDAQHLVGVHAQEVGHFPGHLIGPGRRQVDFVHHGNDFQVGFQRGVEMRDGLGLDALGGVHHQHRAFARGQRAADFVAEVHVSGGVDEVQHVGLAVLRGVFHTHRGGLDGHPPLPLQLHAVQHLLHRGIGWDGAGNLEQAVGQGGFAVVDMGNDAKVADVVLHSNREYTQK